LNRAFNVSLMSKYAVLGPCRARKRQRNLNFSEILLLFDSKMSFERHFCVFSTLLVLISLMGPRTLSGGEGVLQTPWTLGFRCMHLIIYRAKNLRKHGRLRYPVRSQEILLAPPALIGFSKLPTSKYVVQIGNVFGAFFLCFWHWIMYRASGYKSQSTGPTQKSRKTWQIFLSPSALNWLPDYKHQNT